MNVARSTLRDTDLTGRERRTLRRIEDAAAADDPLLDVRLGLALNPLARFIVKSRRRTKAVARWFLA
jgi:hypothetical protein